METADMVKVAVSAAPYSIDKPYSYLVPESLAAAAVPGVRVMVPFGRGNKESEGLILARVQEPKLPGSKAIRQILDPEPVLDKAGIDLALWMRGRYFCTVFEAVKTILPAGLWYGLREIWSLAMEPETARSAKAETHSPKTNTTTIEPPNNSHPCHDFNLFSISMKIYCYYSFISFCNHSGTGDSG